MWTVYLDFNTPKRSPAVYPKTEAGLMLAMLDQHALVVGKHLPIANNGLLDMNVFRGVPA